MAQFAHNNWPSDTTGKSPFFLLMGYNPRTDWKHATSPLPQVMLHLDQFKEAWAQAQNLMINTMLNDYHTGLMEDVDTNPGSDTGEA